MGARLQPAFGGVFWDVQNTIAERHRQDRSGEAEPGGVLWGANAVTE